MPQLTQAEITQNAVAFVHEWRDETRERAEAQSFWNEFLAIFGIRRRRVAVFEKAVRKTNRNTGAIDLFWRGVLLAEHKSRGQNLDKAASQAFEYLENLPDNELPKKVILSDFARFRLFDLETGAESAFLLEDLPQRLHLFGFISGYEKRVYQDQDPVNIAVAEKIGELHDALQASGYVGHKLEIFLVRLVYCLFADDTGIFPKDHFRFFIEEKTDAHGANTGAMLAALFELLDTPDAERQRTLDEEMRQFPYVNGALFKETIRLPVFDGVMRELLLQACAFDWSKVSPAIFGSLFQSVMDAAKRRHLGAHYTSEKNILKAVRGLFLDELESEFESVKHNAGRLRAFHEKIARLRFFDPACGCGNFLVITYREMRRLELGVLKQLRALASSAQLELDAAKLSKIDVNAFYGIELEEFPAQIATVALWLTDHQANMELSAEFGLSYVRLPLAHAPKILHDNALRIDWREVLGMKDEGERIKQDHISDSSLNLLPSALYILGNPPFVGAKMMSATQRQEMAEIAHDVPNFGLLDYVCGWYIKAAQLLTSPRTKVNGVTIKVAFVSTNSITQGEQVGVLWNYLLEQGLKIHFAHRTFKWSNEARGKAAVHCVIIGFAAGEAARKYLFDYHTPTAEPHEGRAVNISPYLIDAADLVIARRHKPLCAVPEMNFGNMPLDGGNLLIETDEERRELLRQHPTLEKFIKRFMGAEEFLNGGARWCFWFVDAQPHELRALPAVVRARIEAVRQFREASKAPSTRKFAALPYLFRDRKLPVRFLVVPSVSSERRHYVPMGFFTDDTVASNLCLIIPDATLYHFGVMASQMQMAWFKQVCGRLKSDYRYSKDIVYNNFPFPPAATEKQRERVAQTAQAILDARAQFPAATLADLYDPHTMPKVLLEAHRANDAAVDACYGTRRFASDLARLEFLFALYRQLTDPLTQLAEKETRKANRRKNF